MRKQKNFFDESMAASYDKRNERLSAVKDTLLFLTQMVMLDLPADARVLCVGAGTGAEIAFLAAQFPRWHFLALDPSKPMLDVCRAKAEELGFADRCSFHEGYLDTLESQEQYQAATSILASQFLLDKNERRDYFRQIAMRLAPNGLLVNADLSSAPDADDYAGLKNVWSRMMEAGGTNFDSSSYGRDVAVLSPAEVETIILSSGFDKPTQFYQTLLVRAWFTRRSGTYAKPNG